jgi:pathogenesis-related protein 1
LTREGGPPDNASMSRAGASRLAAGVVVASTVAVLLVSASARTPQQPLPPPPPPRGPLTSAEAVEMVRAHNAWRTRAGVLSLRWAADLAAHAQNRAVQLARRDCALEHGLLPDDEGENLYRASALHREFGGDALYVVSPAQVVDAWGAESADYSASTGSCAPNRQCGHYTQIVWPSSEEVGCGMAVCPSLGQVWVCRYRPRGNIRVLRR